MYSIQLVHKRDTSYSAITHCIADGTLSHISYSYLRACNAQNNVQDHRQFESPSDSYPPKMIDDGVNANVRLHSIIHDDVAGKSVYLFDYRRDRILNYVVRHRSYIRIVRERRIFLRVVRGGTRRRHRKSAISREPRGR